MKDQEMADKASEEKFLEGLETELCAIKGQAGEIMKRVRELEKKLSNFKRRHEPSLFDERG